MTEKPGTPAPVKQPWATPTLTIYGPLAPEPAGRAALGSTLPSDARLKQDIRPLNPVLASLLALQPVRFRYRTAEFPERHFSTEPTMGLIAQDVERVFPELVTEDDKGYKGIHYEQLPVLLLEGVKELKAENDALKEQNAALEARLAAIEQRLTRDTPPLVDVR
jgi:hypothetical protein